MEQFLCCLGNPVEQKDGPFLERKLCVNKTIMLNFREAKYKKKDSVGSYGELSVGE